MHDQRLDLLAKNLLDYSVRLQPGEKLLLEITGPVTPLTTLLVEKAFERGAFPYVTTHIPEVERALRMGTTAEHVQNMARWQKARMEEMDAWIGIRSDLNDAELSDVPPEKHRLYSEFLTKPVHLDIRVPKTKWCILRYPNPAAAQSAGMSTEAFTNFYFNVCNLDYARMSRAMDPLVELMQRTDQVRLTGPDTDLTFSIKGLPAIKCAGEMNIPDGEIYTAPVRDSVNGVIHYNTISTEDGTRFTDIRFEFKNGKIVKATANETEKLNKILDTDEGARYIGEFAIGVNPYILNPMNETLFDEKINGSIHFTPGMAYDDCFNGNKSAIHWDIVLIQRAEYGGGEMYFDGKLVRKDGRFVLPELAGLNPENLV
jgi:aminopeptidase